MRSIIISKNLNMMQFFGRDFELILLLRYEKDMIQLQVTIGVVSI